MIAILAAVTPCEAQQRVTIADFLQRFTNFDRLYALPGNEQFECYSADFSKPGGQVDGWRAVADATGPGAMTRLWCSRPSGSLRIEVDGQQAFAGKMARFFGGSRPPFEAPFTYTLGDGDGSSCYFPILYARSLRVLVSDSTAACVIECARFAPGTQVEAFTGDLPEGAKQAYATARAALLDGLTDAQIDGPGRIISIASEHSLAPGRLSVEKIDGAGIVRAIYLAQSRRADPVDLYALHRCVIRIFVDGHASPAIEAPLIDFFASGLRRERINTLPAGTNRAVEVPLPERGRGQDEFLYVLLPMPFSNGMRLELLNAGREAVDLLLYMRVARTPPPADSLRLLSAFHQADPPQAHGFELLSSSGAGRLVGALLLADSDDEAIWSQAQLELRGPTLESSCSTIVTQWLGLSSAHVRAQTGLHAVSLAGPYGKRSGVRWLLHDARPLGANTSVRWLMPHSTVRQRPWVGGLVWWYGQVTGRERVPRLQSSDLEVRPLRIPNAVEIEQRIRDVAGAAVTRVSDEVARHVEFSGGAAVSLEAGHEYEVALPYPRAEEVTLSLRVHPRRTFGTITVTTPAGESREIRHQRGAGGIYAVGTVALKAGANTFRLNCSEQVILDCWIIADVTNARPPAGVDGKAPSSAEASGR